LHASWRLFVSLFLLLSGITGTACCLLEFQKLFLNTFDEYSLVVWKRIGVYEIKWHGWLFEAVLILHCIAGRNMV
jgi:hypothetical protein